MIVLLTEIWNENKWKHFFFILFLVFHSFIDLCGIGCTRNSCKIKRNKRSKNISMTFTQAIRCSLYAELSSSFNLIEINGIEYSLLMWIPLYVIVDTWLSSSCVCISLPSKSVSRLESTSPSEGIPSFILLI